MYTFVPYGRHKVAVISLLLAVVLWLPGCKRRQIPPHAPHEALRTFQIPPGFRVELVASEPEISDPVAMAFDEQGRLFVVEMPDYPMGKQNGRIKLLEDKDGDGRFETSTVFAKDLRFPTGVMPWDQGILVTAAPDIIYLADRDGDRQADERRVILTGFATLNPQVRVNGLLYGLDNWIYAAYPKFGLPSRYIKEFGNLGTPLRFPEHTEIPPVDVFGKGMDLRFKLNPMKLEPAAGNSQFGNAFDAWSHRFTVWNNNHIRHVVLQNSYMARNPYLAVPSTMQSPSDHGNAAAVYPTTKQPLHMHESEIGHFTSACGISVYEGGVFPPEYRHTVFVCEPVHNLVHCDTLSPAGATYTAKRRPEKADFLTSSDSWFRPVFTTIGPDGALYVVDFYRKIVEHPEWIPPEMMNEADLYAGNDRGRIYRIVYGDAPRRARPNLHTAPSSDLVRELANPNMWWRMTAQRLLVARRDPAVVPMLQETTRQTASAEARVHALWTLEGYGALDAAAVRQALDDTDPRVREQAVRLAEGYLSDAGIREKLRGMINDPDAQARFQATCTLSQLPAEQSFPALLSVAFRHMEDSWFQIAVLASAADNANQWLRTVTANPEFTAAASEGKQQFLRRLTSIIGARAKAQEITDTLTVLSQTQKEEAVWWQTAALDGLGSRLKRGSENRIELSPTAQSVLMKLLTVRSDKLRQAALQLATNVRLTNSKALQAEIRHATKVAASEKTTLGERVESVAWLGLDTAGATRPVLDQLLSPQQPEEIQAAAARALLAMPDTKGITLLLKKWKSLTAPVREMALVGLFSERPRVAALMDAIETGLVPPGSLNQARRTQLIRFPVDAIQARAKAVFTDRAGDRKAVIEKYRPALQMAGRAENGRTIFKAVCSPCHKVEGSGFEVGPDLASITNRTREDLLTQILNPNAYIVPGYEEYMLETADGRWVTGIMAKETATSIILRRRAGEEDTILRSNINSLRSSSVSLMPENLETDLSLQDMADLLQYLKDLGKKRGAPAP